MSHKPLIQHLGQIVDKAQNGESMDVTKRNIIKAIHHYKPMPYRVESLLLRANSAMSLSYIEALLIDAQSILIFHDIDSLATETRACYPDLLKEVEGMERYGMVTKGLAHMTYDELDTDECCDYIRRDDVIRLLGGDV